MSSVQARLSAPTVYKIEIKLKNRDFNKFRHAGSGIGGYKCRCCGPKQKDRPAYNRRVRRTIKQSDILD